MPDHSSNRADLIIRPARAEEFAAVDELITAAYAHDYGSQGISTGDPLRTSQVRSVDFEIWVATDAAGVLLGSVTTRRPGGRAIHEDFTDDELDVRLLGISPAARRRGIAAALMSHVEHYAHAHGFTAVALKSAHNMIGAHRLYDALGFTHAADRDGLWIGGVRVLDVFTFVKPVR